MQLCCVEQERRHALHDNSKSGHNSNMMVHGLLMVMAWGYTSRDSTNCTEMSVSIPFLDARAVCALRGSGNDGVVPTCTHGSLEK
jgi:hypothetical protein